MSAERVKQPDQPAPAEAALRLWSDEPSEDSSSGTAATATGRRRQRKPPPKPGVTSLDSLPLMLTVDEAAEVLRISRTTAYKLVDQYRHTNGREGLPHRRLGGRVFVRRVDLAEIVGVPPDAA